VFGVKNSEAEKENPHPEMRVSSSDIKVEAFMPLQTVGN